MSKFTYQKFLSRIEFNDDSLSSSLNLSYKIFNEDTFTKLCEVLKKNSNITHINFNNSKFPNDSCNKLLDLLDSNKIIREIGMKDTKNLSYDDKKKIKKKLFENLLPLILSNNNNFTFLNLSDRILTNESFTKLCDILKNNTKITEINFNKSDLPDESSSILLDMLDYNKTINKISIDDTINISEEDKKKIKKKLFENVLPLIEFNDDSLSEYLNLTDIILNEDYFTKLCEVLKKNTKITEIDFSKNEFPIESSSKILDMLEYNKTIRYIDMNDTINITEENKIEINNKLLENVLPLIKSNDDSLSELYLYNKILISELFSKLCEYLKNNTKITEIYLNKSELPNDSCNKLLDMLQHNKRINKINMDEAINISEVDKEKIKNKIFENNQLFLINSNDDKLSSLNLSNSTLDDEYFNKLCEALKKNTKITYINFKRSELPVGSSNKLLNLLKHNKTIRKINMDNSKNILDKDKKKINNKLLENIFPLLSNDDSLSPDLDLSYVTFYEESFNKLCEVLKKNRNVSQINFKFSELPSSSSKKLLDMLEYNKTIREINMYDIKNISKEEKNKINNKLSENYLEVLLPLISSNDDSLTSLDLSYNIFNEDTFTKLCEALKKNSKISKINCNNIEFPDESCVKLLDMLEYNKTIRKIIMDNTKYLSEEDKKIIHNKLFENYLDDLLPLISSNDDSLTYLDLSYNIFNEDTFTKLCEALKKNSKIIKIKFNYSQLVDESCNKILNMLEYNKTIREITMISTKNISYEDKEKINLILKININIYSILIKYESLNNIEVDSIDTLNFSNKILNFSIEDDKKVNNYIENFFNILIKCNKVIKKVNLKSTQISKYFIKNINKLLKENNKENKSIIDVYIDKSTEIDSEESDEYISSIINYSNINFLYSLKIENFSINLSRRNIEDKFINYLLKYIEIHPEVQIIDLSSNMITNEGCDELIKILEGMKMKNIINIKLEDNDIDKEKIEKLNKLLERNKKSPPYLIINSNDVNYNHKTNIFTSKAILVKDDDQNNHIQVFLKFTNNNDAKKILQKEKELLDEFSDIKYTIDKIDYIEDNLKSSEFNDKSYSIYVHHTTNCSKINNDIINDNIKIEKMKTSDDFKSFNFIIMEYGEENLKEFIHKNKKNPTYMHEIKSALLCMGNFLKQIHDRSFIWMDCKPENFVNVRGISSNTFKAIDFESCIRLDKNNDSKSITRNELRFTPLYSCPSLLHKVISGRDKFILSKKYDVFSFGLVIFEALNISNGNKTLWEELFEMNDNYELKNDFIQSISNDNIIEIFDQYFKEENYHTKLTILINNKLKSSINDNEVTILSILNQSLSVLEGNRCNINQIIDRSVFTGNSSTININSMTDKLNEKINNINTLIENFSDIQSKLMNELPSMDLKSDENKINLEKLKKLGEEIFMKVGNIENTTYSINEKVDGFNKLQEKMIKNLSEMDLKRDKVDLVMLKKLGGEILSKIESIETIINSLDKKFDDFNDKFNKFDLKFDLSYKLIKKIEKNTTLEVPLSFIIVPFNNMISNSNKISFIKKCLKNQYRLMFVCPILKKTIECGKDGNGFEVEYETFASELFSKVKPLVKFGYQLLKKAAIDASPLSRATEMIVDGLEGEISKYFEGGIKVSKEFVEEFSSDNINLDMIDFEEYNGDVELKNFIKSIVGEDLSLTGLKSCTFEGYGTMWVSEEGRDFMNEKIKCEKDEKYRAFEVPTSFIIVPYQKTRNYFVYNSTETRYKLVFVCPVTKKIVKCGEKGDGFKISKDFNSEYKNLFKLFKPLLSYGYGLLKKEVIDKSKDSRVSNAIKVTEDTKVIDVTKLIINNIADYLSNKEKSIKVSEKFIEDYTIDKNDLENTDFNKLSDNIFIRKHIKDIINDKIHLTGLELYNVEGESMWVSEEGKKIIEKEDKINIRKKFNNNRYNK